ncbi:MAG TPA: hypothetical protein VJJ77_07500 [Dongiaceae bacterium]|nr:hypothetical protein [Dongiaceae bacterium]
MMCTDVDDGEEIAVVIALLPEQDAILQARPDTEVALPPLKSLEMETRRLWVRKKLDQSLAGAMLYIFRKAA